MRNMSFMLTTGAPVRRQKTVTRRIGWTFLKLGTRLQPVVKSQGIPKGQHVEKIGGPIRVVSVRRERLGAITEGDCAREGFPGWRPSDFVSFFARTHPHCNARTVITRIEFTYED